MAGAVPSLTEILDNVGTSTISARLPGLFDNVYGSNPVIARLLQRNKVIEDGGKDIRQRTIYAKKPSGWYSGLDTFDTSKAETRTEMVFNWKQHEVNITVDGLTLLKNSGGKAIYDLVNDEMDEAEITAADDFGTALFGDGTASNGKVITGLRAVCDNGDLVATYGGITRSSTAQTAGLAVRGNVSTTGVTFSLAQMNTYFGTAVIGTEKPDVIATTQTLWNKWWERAQPSQRFPAGDARGNLAKVGFSGIECNGAEVVVDSHVSANHIFFLNTKFLKLVVHNKRLFTPTGWKYPTDQDAAIQQLLSALELVCASPRLQNLATNVS